MSFVCASTLELSFIALQLVTFSGIKNNKDNVIFVIRHVYRFLFCIVTEKVLMPENMPKPSMLPVPTHLEYAPSFLDMYQLLFAKHNVFCILCILHCSISPPSVEDVDSETKDSLQLARLCVDVSLLWRVLKLISQNVAYPSATLVTENFSSNPFKPSGVKSLYTS